MYAYACVYMNLKVCTVVKSICAHAFVYMYFCAIIDAQVFMSWVMGMSLDFFLFRFCGPKKGLIVRL